ncbi:NYNRIN-like protein [Labeo rohita]|uniref:Gypsy retrotransposon integrase-like protein 1 n=1 Tax=Labeo rohita TaxID=84645 RepID=A0A498M294_LABRO|nr:NYNRIN-like protein [Labeo rohita]
MSHDPTQDYNHKDLAKIIGSLAHNLLAQARLSEASISRLEQEAAALKLRAEEAQRDLALAQSQLDQLETETPHQRRATDEQDPELQEEVERLQKALTDLQNFQTEPHNQITANPLSTTEPDTSSPSDVRTQPSQQTVELPEPTNIQSHTSSQDSNVPESAVLVVCLPDEPHETSPDCLAVNTQVPVPRLLGNLIERGVAKKLYLVITLEKEVRLEALVDTGADLTLMSSQLFDRLQTEAKRQNRTLKYQQCVLNVQSYSQNEVQLEQVAPIHLTIGPMSLVHPVYIAPVDTYPLLIGKDLLDRFEPLLDFKQLKIWAQVREPLPPQSPRSPETDCQATKVTENPTASRGNVSTQEQGSRSILCAFQLDKDFDSDGPQILAGLQLNDVTTTDLILALWADNSAISLTLFNALKSHTTNISFANKRTRFALNPGLSTLVTAKVICALNLNWNDRCLTHYFLVLPDLPHDVYIGADILIRLKAHVDLLNGVIWAPMTSQASAVPVNPENLLSGQTIPEACTLISEQEPVIPAYTKGVAVRLNLRCGQTLSHSLGFFQPSPECVELGLTLEATPLIEVTSRALYILFNNCMAMDVRVPKAYRLGWLVSYDFQDFELVLPVIGPLPVSMIPEGSSSHTVLTVPFKIITILSVVPVVKEQVCRTELTVDQHLAVYTVSSHPTCETDNATAPPTVHQTDDVKTGEPYPGFETQVQQILKDADALQEDADRHKLRQVLYKYKDSFAKDSLDCGLTDLHVVRVPTHPKAPPTFVKQYKIPLESYEPVQEIINSMLEKGVIRPCNSTYSAPIWPVLKPNGKWRPTVDYRKLNQQVPLSRWPMTQLEQEIPRIRGATIFSTLDVASGFWTIPVHPDDQHKLAFRFDNRQYTFTRCPFGYANSPAEFNIFLNKACPDASVRGNLVFVDDILLKHTTVADHLKEIDHILHQLTTAGAKIALHKGQWCKIRVNYVGLLIGPQGIEPQTNRIQAIQNIKPPANVSELRSFLGVCNYSRQFIENYSDIARPLTALLKKDCPFIWTDTQQDAMNELKQHLCTAPCLAYPDPQKEIYLDAGFSSHCLSAGLYQRHDQDRRVVAYASKTLLPPECKYSDCEKALLCTVWAIQRFSNYIGAQKVIIETCHQPVTFLNSQRIRAGVVTNARIATWLMALQGRNVEARYAQNYKSALGNGLAACQSCSDDTPTVIVPAETPPDLPLTCHRYFEESVCQGMPTAYVDGRSYNHEGLLKAGAGVLWLNDRPCPPQHFKLGPQSSQYAEVAAILITLQIASAHNIRDLLICTDSNYARLSFTCHLPNWKQNGFKTANNKPVKHQHLFQICDDLTSKHDMIIYWKKVKGHSKQPGTDKDLNDQTDALAKAGALHGELWTPPTHPPTPNVAAITRSKRTVPTTVPTSQPLMLAPQISTNDIADMQATDSSIQTILHHLSDPSNHPITPAQLANAPSLKRLHDLKPMLRVMDDILWYVPDDNAAPRLVVPQGQRGVWLMNAHDAACAGHHGTSATYETLKQVAYWPGMQQDVAEYVKGCLVCCQFQPAHPNHRAPLQRRGVTFPWSDLQIDWVGPLPRSTRGNKYFLTVVCQFTKWGECLPAPNDTAQTTAYLLMNHIFSRFGLPLKVNSDRGTHFTAEIMQQIWKLLGIHAQLHISHHPISSGQVERSNQTVVSMLRKYVSANQKDWDVKLPLVLMAIRATPNESTGVSPFELMTGRLMTLPLHLLYQPGDSNLVTAYNTHQYLDELRRHLRSTFAFAQQRLQKSAEGQKAYYDRKASHAELDVGDKVWYYQYAQPPQTTSHRLSKKFLPHWTGPHEIVDKLSPVAYRIKLSRGQKDPVFKWVHRNQIKRHVAAGRERQGGANA